MRHYLALLFMITILRTGSFAQCSPSSAVAELDVNNVRTMLSNGGDFWTNPFTNSPGYEFPKVSSPDTPVHIISAGGIWLSSINDQGELRTAAMTYRSNQGVDFFPGPIDSSTGEVTGVSCTAFDRFWEISREEVQRHLDSISLGVPLTISSIDSIILEWPARGNVHFTEYDIQDDMAPFVDVNDNGIYDPENGDYPNIKGDQAFFWVFNDIGNVHEVTRSAPIGVEVQMMAYAYNDTTASLDNTTFYDVKVLKKALGGATNFVFGLFVDPDIGDPDDDYVGCDTMSNTGYAYNANPIDAQYDGNPPIISTSFWIKK